MSRFYRRYAVHLSILLLAVFPFLLQQGESLPSNNDIETWLPRVSTVRSQYEDFKRQFGAEEVILVGLPHTRPGDPIVEAIAGRLQLLPGIRQCWSPRRLRQVMAGFEVPSHVIDDRLEGLAVSRDKTMVGIIALLSKEGLSDREGTVADVKDVLRYCQLGEDDVLLTGAPVVVSELNRLGSNENNRQFFYLTLIVSLLLLQYALKDWRLSGSILFVSVIAIELTNSTVKWMGGESNFILSAMPVMVLVFTLSTSVHFVHYYRSSLDREDPLESALRRSWKPCGLSMLTTAIGLLSLMVSEIGPVRQFGMAGAIGSLAAMLCGLGLTPIAFVLWPNCVGARVVRHREPALRCAHAIVLNSRPIAAGCVCLALFCSVGLMWLTAKIDPLDFLPTHSEVVRDLLRVEEELTNVESIEAVVDFGTQDLTFVEKLNRVRALDQKIASHPAVRHTMSLATFFPERLAGNAFDAARILSAAQANENRGDFISAGERFWRISARVQGETTAEKEKAYNELQAMLAGDPVVLTGIAPLLENAQREIFRGFWESFFSAFLIITVIMALALRSIKTALIAMLPNLFPIALVFGAMSWLGWTIDIGITMTASIALGIAVDGTFHFLVAYQKRLGEGCRPSRAAWHALVRNGEPIFQAAIIASVGMLALTTSSFAPTVRFGLLMATLLMVAVVGDLVFLPSLLSLSSHFIPRRFKRRVRRTTRPSVRDQRVAA